MTLPSRRHWAMSGDSLDVTVGRYYWCPVSTGHSVQESPPRNVRGARVKKPCERQTTATKCQIYINSAWGTPRRTDDFGFSTYSIHSLFNLNHLLKAGLNSNYNSIVVTTSTCGFGKETIQSIAVSVWIHVFSCVCQ